MNSWFKIVNTTDFGSFAEVRQVFPSADLVDNLVIFNVGGNNYRVIVFFNYKFKKLFIRHVLTHKEYNKENWKKDKWLTSKH